MKSKDIAIEVRLESGDPCRGGKVIGVIIYDQTRSISETGYGPVLQYKKFYLSYFFRLEEIK